MTPELDKAEKRFWAKVNKNGPVPSHVPKIGNCWVWIGATYSRGYAMFSVATKPVRASRWIYKHTFGAFDESLFCLHRCDNPLCVRPSHLFLGTNQDNMKDCVAKGRNQFSMVTHCKHGHLLTARTSANPGRVWRECKTCKQARGKASYLKNKYEHANT